MPTVTLTADRDTWISASAVNTNYGTQTTMRCFDYTNPNRCLVGFTLPELPEGAVVTSAILALTSAVVAYEIPWGKSLLIHRTTKPWLESQATWSSWATGQAWDSAGGDYGAGSVAKEWEWANYNWDIAAFVAAAYDEEDLSLGLIAKWDTEGLAAGYSEQSFYTRNNIQLPPHPRLTIEYFVPPPVVPYVGLPYRVEVRDVDGHLIAIPRAVFSGQLTRSLNMPDGLSFQIAADDPACKYMTPRYELWVRDLSTGEIVSVCKTVMTEASNR